MSNDVVIVTGGTRGIGAAIARQAAAEGYGLCLTYARDDEAAERLEDELRRAGHACALWRGGVEHPDGATGVFDLAEARLGPVTALVNNAGITGPIGRFEDVTPETFRRVLDVNVLGSMLMAQEALRRWRRRGTAGRIVNVSSIAATLGAPGEYIHYAASKAAVEALTVGLAKEVAASGIRVNAVAPGTAFTDIHAAAGEPDRPARVASRVPMGRIGQPEEIAEAVLWLLSSRASYVTGAVVRVAGGL